MPFDFSAGRGYNPGRLSNQKEKTMKKVLLLGFAVFALAACTGSYRDGKCDYHYLLHPQISVTRLVGCP